MMSVTPPPAKRQRRALEAAVYWLDWLALGRDLWKFCILPYVVLEAEIDAVCTTFNTYIYYARRLLTTPEKTTARVEKNRVPRLVADFLTENAQKWLQAYRNQRAWAQPLFFEEDNRDTFLFPTLYRDDTQHEPYEGTPYIDVTSLESRICGLCLFKMRPGRTYRYSVKVFLPALPLSPAPALEDRIYFHVLATTWGENTEEQKKGGEQNGEEQKGEEQNGEEQKTCARTLEIFPDIGYVCYFCLDEVCAAFQWSSIMHLYAEKPTETEAIVLDPPPLLPLYAEEPTETPALVLGSPPPHAEEPTETAALVLGSPPLSP